MVSLSTCSPTELVNSVQVFLRGRSSKPYINRNIIRDLIRGTAIKHNNSQYVQSAAGFANQIVKVEIPRTQRLLHGKRAYGTFARVGDVSEIE